MNIDDMISGMTPEVYQRLVTAVELGKWPDGVALTPEQKENSLLLVMAVLPAPSLWREGVLTLLFGFNSQRLRQLFR